MLIHAVCDPVAGYLHACLRLSNIMGDALTRISGGMCCCAQADMVLTSIGYKAVAMEGVSFDAARGVIRHRWALQTCYL